MSCYQNYHRELKIEEETYKTTLTFSKSIYEFKQKYIKSLRFDELDSINFQDLLEVKMYLDNDIFKDFLDHELIEDRLYYVDNSDSFIAYLKGTHKHLFSLFNKFRIELAIYVKSENDIAFILSEIYKEFESFALSIFLKKYKKIDLNISGDYQDTLFIKNGKEYSFISFDDDITDFEDDLLISLKGYRNLKHMTALERFEEVKALDFYCKNEGEDEHISVESSKVLTDEEIFSLCLEL